MNPQNGKDGQTGQTGMTGQNGKQTNGKDQQLQGVRDDHYAVVSTIYHALQGCETCRQYEQDAREAGNEELAQFFSDVQKEQLARANKAKKFLKEWVGSEAQSDTTSTQRSQQQSTSSSSGMGMDQGMNPTMNQGRNNGRSHGINQGMPEERIH